MNPSVSVIIPTYNRARFIGETIASVLAQTFADFEIIVVDDGSTDDTELIINTIVDPRLHYIRQKNLGRSNARNHALSLARGKYITFLDSDDLYLPNKIELQVRYLDKHPDVGMIYTSAYCINDDGEMLTHKYEASVSGHIYEQIAFFTPVTITLPTVMTRREIMDHVGGFDENMHRFEDTDMWRRISKIAQIQAMPEFTCKLRTHADNSLASQQPDQIIVALDYYANKVLRQDVEVGNLTLRIGLGGLYYYYASAFLTIPRWNDHSLSLLHKSYRYWPLYRVKYLLTKLKFLVLNRIRRNRIRGS